MGLQIFFANVVGAVLDFVYLTYLLPPGTAPGTTRAHQQAVTLAVFVVYMVVIIPTAVVAGLLVGRPVWRWLDQGRPPTDRERESTLALPLRESLVGLGGWTGATVLFAVLTFHFSQSPAQALRVAVGVGLGGLTTTALMYLLIERTMRPVFALALADSTPTRPRLGIAPRLLLSWGLGSGVPLLGIGLGLLGSARLDRTRLVTAVAFLAALGVGVGGAMMLAAARSVSDPLHGVRRGLRRVQEGRLDTQVPVNDVGEIGMVQAGFNQMAAGLLEREQLRELFGRHVGEEVARQALERGTDLGGEQRELSALFVDIIGSTAMAQDRAPTDVVDALNAFFDRVVRVVGEEGGWVNKFEGDGALCVFGAPADQPDHAGRALRAARRLRTELDGLSSADLDAGIGVSSGSAVAGNVGAAARYEYTVIGDPVNEAARLCDAAKQRPARVLASDAAVAAAGDEGAHWVPVGEFELRGRRQATLAYEPVPDQGAEASALQARSIPSSSTS